MALGLHNLKPARGARKIKKRLGRGSASGHGAYSGRGQKGQRARSGGKGGLKRLGLKTMLQNKPKLGGFTSPYAKLQNITLEKLEQHFDPDEIVNIKKLVDKKLINGIKPGVKVLGTGNLTKKLTVVADAFSESAKKAILDAGGTATVRNKKSTK